MGGPGSGGPASLDPTRKKILEWVLKATPEQVLRFLPLLLPSFAQAGVAATRFFSQIHRLNPDAQELVLKIRQQNMLNQNQRRP